MRYLVRVKTEDGAVIAEFKTDDLVSDCRVRASASGTIHCLEVTDNETRTVWLVPITEDQP